MEAAAAPIYIQGRGDCRLLEAQVAVRVEWGQPSKRTRGPDSWVHNSKNPHPT